MGRATTPSSTVKDAYSSGRLPGDVNATASATVDGNPATAWQPGSGQGAGGLHADLRPRQAADADRARHAGDRGRPAFRPDGDDDHVGQPDARLAVPPIADGTVPGAVTTVPVTFPALTGSHFVVTFTGVRPEYAANYYSAGPLETATGHRGDRHPGVKANPTPAALPGNCVSNLLTIDGQPISVRWWARRSRPSTAASPSWSRAGPTPRASPWARGRTWCRRWWVTTLRVPAHRPPARGGTSTSWPSTRRPVAAPDRVPSPPRPARRSCRPPNPGRPPP